MKDFTTKECEEWQQPQNDIRVDTSRRWAMATMTGASGSELRSFGNRSAGVGLRSLDGLGYQELGFRLWASAPGSSVDCEAGCGHQLFQPDGLIELHDMPELPGSKTQNSGQYIPKLAQACPRVEGQFFALKVKLLFSYSFPQPYT